MKKLKEKNEDFLNNINQMSKERNELLQRLEYLSESKSPSNKANSELLKQMDFMKKTRDLQEKEVLQMPQGL